MEARWRTSLGSRSAAGPQGLARGEPPPSAPVPAYPRESTSLPPAPPAIFPGLLSCPCAPASSPSSLDSFSDLHIRALPRRIRGRRGQLLTPNAEDTWLSPPTSPSLVLSFPPLSRGVKAREGWDAGACAQAFLCLEEGPRARGADSRLLVIPASGSAPQECAPVPSLGRRVRCNVQAVPYPSAEPLPSLFPPRARQAWRPASPGWRRLLAGAPGRRLGTARGEAGAQQPSCRPGPAPAAPAGGLPPPPRLAPPLPSAPWQPAPPPPARPASSVAMGTGFFRAGNRFAFFGLFTPTSARQRRGGL